MRTDDIQPALAALFDPRSVAIVGASDKTGKWGNILAQTVLKGAHRREVFLVNQQGGEILGRPSLRRLEDAATAPELAIIVVPERHFDDALDSALAVGSRAVIAISAGLNTDDPAWKQGVRERLRAAGAVMLGPNCMGVINTGSELSAAAHLTLPRGDIALLSQSGGLGMEIGNRARQLGLGFSRFISLGNQVDLSAVDFIHDLATHSDTSVIALYLEHLGEGRKIAAACAFAAERGKRVVLLAPARNTATQRAARSHTGSLAGDDQAIEALCRSAGIIRVSSPREMLDAAAALRHARPPRGGRIAIVSDGGGAAVIAADLVSRAGFTVPEFSAALSASLAEKAHPFAAVDNPLDLLADDPDSIARSIRIVAASGEVDAIVFTGVYGSTSAKEYPPELGDLAALELAEVDAAHEIAAIAQERDVPIVGATIAGNSPIVPVLAAAGVPVYGNIEAAVSALSWLRQASRGHAGPQAMPARPADPVSASDYEGSRDFLASEGVPFPPARFVRNLAEALDAASAVGFPLVLKATGLLHKSDQGGVVLDIKDRAGLTLAFETMAARLNAPRYSVERMARVSDGVEVIIGSRWDEQLGPLVMVGLGGIFAETLRDVQTALAPAGAETMKELIEGLRGAEIFKGLRGRAPVDVDALAELAARISHVAALHPEIREMELNPVLALADGVLSLDARIILKDDTLGDDIGSHDGRATA